MVYLREQPCPHWASSAGHGNHTGKKIRTSCFRSNSYPNFCRPFDSAPRVRGIHLLQQSTHQLNSCGGKEEEVEFATGRKGGRSLQTRIVC